MLKQLLKLTRNFPLTWLGWKIMVSLSIPVQCVDTLEHFRKKRGGADSEKHPMLILHWPITRNLIIVTRCTLKVHERSTHYNTLIPALQSRHCNPSGTDTVFKTLAPCYERPVFAIANRWHQPTHNTNNNSDDVQRCKTKTLLAWLRILAWAEGIMCTASIHKIILYYYYYY